MALGKNCDALKLWTHWGLQAARMWIPRHQTSAYLKLHRTMHAISGKAILLRPFDSGCSQGDRKPTVYMATLTQFNKTTFAGRHVRYFHLKTIHDMVTTIHNLSPPIPGTSVGLNDTGSITAVAFATENHISHICWEKRLQHVFHKFKKDQTKVSFFGDPKQRGCLIPPRGAEQAKLKIIPSSISSISETAYLLDTHYKTLITLRFLSKHVYDNKLRSERAIKRPSRIQFMDVCKGEERRSGSKSKNIEEVHTIVRLVKQYYNKTDFCVITPYAAQRAAISMQLKKENLRFDRVFNVDSFQGNEADYVIVSALPALEEPDKRMLTRCKKGMVIVTSRQFLRGGGGGKMLGLLVAEFEAKWRRPGRTGN
ncbi:hypothetical protein HETIRDRAFT_152688 [Heterobasidion irregulare TC 32-1]|uniref:DNA2/NAM7 helicase-like C-terminal domain-containing protein n=1 Tax=Heterobasidion irregulare (strain TC 32-1) TaxID=747525 RepID=W4KCC9_HETIT|nr:uncharacterized protein HETIRDRAFT_152688 [Heterobasidion irregulare TC 32-1]ETW82995.1 hypothetical protein HETIRDRAFT_152688 [Heterobasidion irregulare TC 32-1]